MNDEGGERGVPQGESSQAAETSSTPEAYTLAKAAIFTKPFSDAVSSLLRPLQAGGEQQQEQA